LFTGLPHFNLLAILHSHRSRRSLSTQTKNKKMGTRLGGRGCKHSLLSYLQVSYICTSPTSWSCMPLRTWDSSWGSFLRAWTLRPFSAISPPSASPANASHKHYSSSSSCHRDDVLLCTYSTINCLFMAHVL